MEEVAVVPRVGFISVDGIARPLVYSMACLDIGDEVEAATHEGKHY